MIHEVKMIDEVKMYTVVCDNCGYENGVEQEYSCLNGDSFAEQNAFRFSGWLKHEGKHYCPGCYSYGYNDELVLRKIERLQRKDGRKE